MMDTHDYRIDRLRLLACFGVVLLHSTAGATAGVMALNAFFRFSVPVFVLISGWFQLSAPIPGKRLARKCGILFGKLLLWSGIYLAARWFLWGIWPKDLTAWLLTEPVHLWYLYAAMGLYLLTPALHPFVRSADREEYRYALIVCFLLGCVVVTLVRLEWIPLLAVILDKSKLPDMLGFVFLYLLGGWFRRFGFENRRFWVTAGILGALISIGFSKSPWNQQLLSFLAPNVVLSGAACFVVYMTRKPPAERSRSLLRRASECTMGVYLLHPLVSSLISPALEPVRGMLFPVGYMLLRCGCIFTISFGCIWLLTCSRFLKKYAL